MQISVGIFPDQRKQCRVIYGSDKFDPRIFVKSGLRLQFFIEFIVLHIRDQHKVLIGSGLHKFPQHGLIIILRHKASDHQIVSAAFHAVFLIPRIQFRCGLRSFFFCFRRSIGDICRCRMIFRIASSDIAFDIL